MFEQTFKNIDDILHKDAGCGSELDYVEQTSWVLFLKYLDDLEKDKATAAELTGKIYSPIIDEAYQWNVWATPKDKNGKPDHHKALSGDDLKDFVDLKLFPYLKKFKADAESADTLKISLALAVIFDIPGPTAFTSTKAVSFCSSNANTSTSLPSISSVRLRV